MYESAAGLKPEAADEELGRRVDRGHCGNCEKANVFIGFIISFPVLPLLAPSPPSPLSLLVLVPALTTEASEMPSRSGGRGRPASSARVG